MAVATGRGVGERLREAGDRGGVRLGSPHAARRDERRNQHETLQAALAHRGIFGWRWRSLGASSWNQRVQEVMRLQAARQIDGRATGVIERRPADPQRTSKRDPATDVTERTWRIIRTGKSFHRLVHTSRATCLHAARTDGRR